MKILSLLIFLGFMVSVNSKVIILGSYSHMMNQNASSFDIIKGRWPTVTFPDFSICNEILFSEHGEVGHVMNSQAIDNNCEIYSRSAITAYYVTILTSKNEICIYNLWAAFCHDKPCTIATTLQFETGTWADQVTGTKTKENLAKDISFISDLKEPYKKICDYCPKNRFHCDHVSACFETVNPLSSFWGSYDKVKCHFGLGVKKELLAATDSQRSSIYVGRGSWKSIVGAKPTDYNSIELNPCKFKKDCKTATHVDNIYKISIGSKGNVTEKFFPEIMISLENDPKSIENYCCYEMKDQKEGDTCFYHTTRGYYESTFDIGWAQNFKRIDLKDCIVGKCGGDKQFCSIFGCTREVGLECKFQVESAEFKMRSKDKWITPGEIISSKENIPLIVSTHGHRFSTDCSACESSCIKGTYRINAKLDKIKLIEICKFPLCLNYNLTNQSNFEINLPRTMILHPGLIKTKLWMDGNDKSISRTDYCEPISFCDVKTNYFSLDHWTHPQCYSAGQYTTIIMLMTLGFLILVPLLILLKRIIMFSHRLLRTPIRFIINCVKYCGRKTRSIFTRMHNHVSNESQSDDVESGTRFSNAEDQSAVRKPVRLVKYNNNRNNEILFLTILFGLFLSALSCDVTSKLVIEQNQCQITESGNEICSITSSVRIAVAPVGQTSCFIMTKMGKPMGSIQIRTNDIKLSCSLNSLYYIPDVKIQCSGAHNCRGAGFCSMDFKECNHPEQWTMEIFKQKPHLSWHRCAETTGRAGCFHNSACQHYQSSLSLKSQNYVSAYDCSEWGFSASLTVTISQVDTVKTKEISLRPSSKEVFNSLSMNLISVSVPPSVLTNKCFLKRGNLWTLSECNRRGDQSTGKPGEVQCPSVNSVTTSGLEGCFASENLIKVLIKNAYVDCESKLMEIERYFDETLPMNYGNSRVFLDEDDVPAVKYNSQALLEIQLDMEDQKLISNSDQNLCYGKFLNVSGCYNCPHGAELFLEVNTNFGSANGIFKCPFINYLTSMRVTKDVEVVKLFLQTGEAEIEGNCYLACPAGEKEIIIKGSLHYIPASDHQSNNTISGVVIGSDGEIDWSNLIKIPSLRIFSIITIVCILTFVVFILIRIICLAIKIKKN